MRKLANPPGAIKLVLEAVCVVLDVKPAKVGVRSVSPSVHAGRLGRGTDGGGLGTGGTTCPLASGFRTRGHAKPSGAQGHTLDPCARLLAP